MPQSYEVIIVSPSFAGKTTLKKHREGAQAARPTPTHLRPRDADLLPCATSAVNDKLKDEIAELHAFTQVSWPPWRSDKSARHSVRLGEQGTAELTSLPGSLAHRKPSPQSSSKRSTS